VLIVPGEAAELPALRTWRSGRPLVLVPAESFGEAARDLQRSAFDLVICDARRSAERALELVRDTRARGSFVPFLLLAPGSLDEVEHRARTLGGTFCVPARELDADLLNELVERAVGPVSNVRPARPEESGDAAPALLWKTAADGAFTQFTHAWSQFTGRPATQDLGSGWIAGMHPEDVDRWIETFTAALASKTGFQVDVRLRRVDGAYRWLRFRGVPRRDAGGGFAGFVGSSFDIDDLKATHASLVADVERLASVKTDLEQFAYAAAHDLDEPLRTLERALNDEPDLDVARGSARRMRALVRDLLECTLVGTNDSAMEAIDLSTPLDWALQNLAQRIEESEAAVTRDSLPVVNCDPIQVARAFQNLIGNAIKFRGDDPPKVHVSAHTTRSEVVLTVVDNGIGIEPEHHQRIFEPFKRVHARPSAPEASDPTSGSGIGLALCKRIAERHGGRIWVESEPQKGSSFYFTLKR